jgi:hypothetical protein
MPSRNARRGAQSAASAGIGHGTFDGDKLVEVHGEVGTRRSLHREFTDQSRYVLFDDGATRHQKIDDDVDWTAAIVCRRV